MASRLSQKVFLERLQKVWGERFDYSDTLYAGSTKLISMRCLSHGEFTVNARQHLLGKSHCPECMKFERSISYDEFLQRAYAKHGERFTYLAQTWALGRIRFICSIHGVQEALWFNHLSGNGCSSCSREHSKLSAMEAFARLQSAHGDRYRLLYESFEGTVKAAKIECKEHGVQRGYLGNLLKGQLLLCCSKSARESRLEDEVFDFVSSISSSFIRGDRKLLSGLELDIYSPELALAIEVNGDYWHSDAVLSKQRGVSALEYHGRKLKLCGERAVALAFVWESDWRNSGSEIRESLTRYVLDHVFASSLLRLE